MLSNADSWGCLDGIESDDAAKVALAEMAGSILARAELAHAEQSLLLQKLLEESHASWATNENGARQVVSSAAGHPRLGRAPPPPG